MLDAGCWMEVGRVLGVLVNGTRRSYLGIVFREDVLSHLCLSMELFCCMLFVLESWISLLGLRERGLSHDECPVLVS